MLLKKLSESHGVSGQEQSIRELIRSEIEDSVDEIGVDRIGNLVVYKKGKLEGRKMAVVAHMDEVGLMVTKITSDGLIKFTLAGSFDSRMLVSKIVSIGESSVKGVIGAKPIHLQERDERKTALKVSQLYIDIGAKKKEEAEKRVNIGDYVAIESEFKHYGEKLVKGKALDSRASCNILVDLIKGESDYSFYGVFSVMKEVGIFGGGPAIYDISPDYTLILDGIDGELGKGPIINIKELRTRFDEAISKEILVLGKTENLPVQISGMDYNNSDGSRVQLSGSGNKTVKIGIPCKYMKTPVNFINMDDYKNTKKLLEKTINLLGGMDSGI